MIKYHSKFALLLLIILLATHFLTGINIISRLSPTYDEPVHLTAGYSFLKNKYHIDIFVHPPLARIYAALPLIFMEPIFPTNHIYWTNHADFSFADVFLYRNKIDAEKMLNTGRIMILILSCLLGLFIYLWTKELYGQYSGIFALILYVFNSNTIAHGMLVTTDFALTLFYFLNFYIFWYWLKNQDWKTTILLAFTTALTLTVKFPGLVVLGVYFIFLILPNIRKKIKISQKEFFFHILFFLVFTFLFISVVYKFTLIGLYFKGLGELLNQTRTGQISYLCGMHSAAGWLYYFVITFLLKTPIPLLILIVLSLIINRKNLINVDTTILLLPAIVYFLLASISKKQIGHRYILCIYPFIFVWVSGVLSRENIENLQKSFRYLLPILCLLLLWNVISFVKIHPWHISYFNEFIGGPRNGYKYLSDSSIDWGHGLKELGKWYKEQKLKGIYLCYFGNADPHYYGIKYIPFGMVSQVSNEERTSDKILFSDNDRIVFAISITNLNSTYYSEKGIFDWLKKYKPDKIIAYSIFIYELTNREDLLKEFTRRYS